MNQTLHTLLNSTLALLSLIALLAFLFLTHPLVINVLADEIIPVR